MSRKRVYVAGAYSADNVLAVLANMRRGIALSAEVLQAGYAPFCPWLDYHFALVNGELTLEDFYEYSMAWLEVADAMLLVPEGAEQSKGTQAEIARAYELNIPIYTSLEALVDCE